MEIHFSISERKKHQQGKTRVIRAAGSTNKNLKICLFSKYKLDINQSFAVPMVTSLHILNFILTYTSIKHHKQYNQNDIFDIRKTERLSNKQTLQGTKNPKTS